jgi:multidrug efflux pump
VNPSAIFIRRPVATTLLTLAIALVGIAAYFVLPVAALPSVDFPAVFVQASLPGGSPEVMATSVATPLERRFGQIADLTELTSQSSTNSTRVIMIFGLDRDINGAARDVEAAINAARQDLPTSLRSNPTYRKVNPADAPIMILNLTSDTMTPAQIYDAAATIIQQKLSQVSGVGEVDITGSNPAVRIELNPTALNHYGIGPEDVRAAVSAVNGNLPKGQITAAGQKLQIYTNDQAYTAKDYAPIVVAYRDGAAVRLSDVADVQDSVEDLRTLTFANGKPAISVRITKSPGANVISTVDTIKSLLPIIEAQLPKAIHLEMSVDRTITIRASLFEVERTLLIAVILVVLVVLVFLRNGRATLIPGVAVTCSLLGTLAVMFLFKFSLDNLSLMALTVATGFVVDDAIVVLENITRHVENGMPRFKAALVGSAEVGFTVISISISLIAVFLPILLMGGIVGRLFREFAVTLSASILISLFISLTATPMMAARLIDEKVAPDSGAAEPPRRKSLYKRAVGRLSSGFEKGFTFLQETYEDSLKWALDHSLLVLFSLFATIILTFWFYGAAPKGFFPQEDTGQLQGGVVVDQASSFKLTRVKFQRIVDIIRKDPAVQTVTGFQGGGFSGLYAQLKPLNERGGLSSDEVIQRLRPKLFRVPGAQTFLQTVQDIRVGGRQSNAQYQYTLKADDLGELQTWADKLTNQLKLDPTLTDVNSDAQPHGLETMIHINYDAAARLGLTVQQIDNTLGDSFNQRNISVIYQPLNQYEVIMESDPKYAATPEALDQVYVSTSNASGSNYTGGSGPRAAGTGAATAILPQPFQTIQADLAANARLTAPKSGGGVSQAPIPFVAQTVQAGQNQVSTGASNAATTATVVGGVYTASGLTGAGSTRSSTGASSQAQTGIAVTTSKERMVPLSAFASYGPDFTPVQVNHQDSSAATTISFNLPPGKALSDAQVAISKAIDAIHMPETVRGSFQGTAQQFQQSLATEPLLILSALVAVYIVLGVLYESYVHPITVLSTLPSAGVGAVAALMIFHVQFDIIALIGVILLIGIVKKNAILIIDFALVAEREQGLSTRDAIYQACMLRFRPILMTTCAAILGALPLAIGIGVGGELRRPLGIAIIGGLVASQVLTLLTTPVVYLYMDKLRKPRPRSKLGQRLRSGLGRPPAAPAPQAS